jgi:methylenetetrahydrofolate reductase (NADPH)
MAAPPQLSRNLRSPERPLLATQHPTSALARELASGNFVVTTEVSPPVSTDLTEFRAKAARLRGVATAVNVTDGAGAKAHMSTLVASYALQQDGIEPILQITCRDRNRLAIQSDLLGAYALGLRNVLILGGDDPKGGDQPDTKAVFDLNSGSLLAMIDHMRAQQALPPGTPIGGAFTMLLGATDMPTDPAPGWEPKGLAAKVAAGANFVQTQFCMDMGIVRRYAARLVDLGLAQKAPILIGVCPIPSARSARWMKEKLFGTIIPEAIIDRLENAVDPKAEGVAMCAEIMRELATIPGIAGAHVMAPVNPSVVPDLIAKAAVAGKPRARV